MFYINLAEQRNPSSISAKPTYNESFVYNIYCHRSRNAIDFTQYSIRNCAHENHCGETSPAQPQYVAMSRSGGREVAKRDLWYMRKCRTKSQQQYSAISRSRIGERCASYMARSLCSVVNLERGIIEYREFIRTKVSRFVHTVMCVVFTCSEQHPYYRRNRCWIA